MKPRDAETHVEVDSRDPKDPVITYLMIPSVADALIDVLDEYVKRTNDSGFSEDAGKLRRALARVTASGL